MKVYDVIIIGGGASGLMCSAFLVGKNSLIIDKSALGKKLLVTGNGRCNFTNKKIVEECYNTPAVKPFLNRFNNEDLMNYFSSIGIEYFADEEGRVYPVSETAKDVKDVLVSAIKSEYINDEVVEIEKEDYFHVKTLNGNYYAEKVVMACGNKDLQKILKNFNFKFEKEKNILTGFMVENFDKNLLGVRENAILKCEKYNFFEKGQIQFRKDGISGIVVFNLSAKLPENVKYPFEVCLELLPEINEKELKEILTKRTINSNNLSKKQCLISLLKPEMANYIIKKSGIKEPNADISYLTQLEIDEIVKNIKNLTFMCTNTYDDCQVLAGGIKLEKLNNFESKIKGLYFVGETTNVYGVCGGYNLQWAFTSGRLVADEIND